MKTFFDPIILLAASLWLFIVAESSIFPLFLFSVVFLFALVIYRLYRLHYQFVHLRYFQVIALSSIGWILFGQLLSLQSFYSSHDFDFRLNYNWSERQVNDWPLLCLALSASFLYSAIFAFISSSSIVRRQEILFSRMLKSYLLERYRLVLKNSLFMNALVSLFLLYLVLSGKLGFRGAMNDLLTETGQSWWGPLISISLQLLPFTLALIFASPQSQRLPKVLSIFTLMLGVYISFTISRRSIIYFILFSAYAYYYIYYSIIGKWPKLRVGLIVSTLFVINTLPNLLLFFQYLRTFNLDDIFITSYFNLYIDFINVRHLYQEIQLKQAENFIARPLLHISLAELIRLDSFRLTYFTDIVNSFLISLPSFLVPFKDQIVNPKGLLAASFGFSTDFRISAQTSAYQSFGFFGFFLYPILQVFMYSSYLFTFFKTRVVDTAGIPALLLLASWFFQLMVEGISEGTTVSLIVPLFYNVALIIVIYISSLLGMILFKRRSFI